MKKNNSKKINSKLCNKNKYNFTNNMNRECDSNSNNNLTSKKNNNFCDEFDKNDYNCE